MRLLCAYVVLKNRWRLKKVQCTLPAAGLPPVGRQVQSSQITNLHVRFDQVRARFGHNFSGFLADFCFPMVQI